MTTPQQDKKNCLLVRYVVLTVYAYFRKMVTIILLLLTDSGGGVVMINLMMVMVVKVMMIIIFIIITVDDHDYAFVSNVNGDISLKDLETMFSAFGSIISCQFLPFDSSGSSSAAAAVGSTKRLIVEYTEAANAISTWLSMNNFKLGGLILQCEVITLSAARQLLQPITAMMSSSNASAVPTSSTVEYKVVLLNNMITVEDTKDPDLKDEIAEEAKNYGELLRVDILVDHVAVKASVKLLYKDANGAARAVKAMNNRNFGGNTIAASLVPE